jgi:hypothetical protein
MPHHRARFRSGKLMDVNANRHGDKGKPNRADDSDGGEGSSRDSTA